jgi:hypothetical protein
MYPPEQFSLDLTTLYYLATSPPKVLYEPFLTQLVTVFAEIYAKQFKPISQPNRAYDLFLRTTLEALENLTDKIHPCCLDQPPSNAPFSIAYALSTFVIQHVPGNSREKEQWLFESGQREAYESLAEPFKRRRIEFEALQLLNWKLDSPTGIFREPEYPDLYDEDDVRRYLKEKKQYDKDVAKAWDEITSYELAVTGTPLYPYADRLLPQGTIVLPFEIPEELRFEHHWIVATSGHGKTQCLQTMIAHDLEAVKEGKASIVVIDSENKLVQNIAHLKVFAPGQPLHGRLVYLDPTDLEFPLSINLFDIGQGVSTDRLARYQRTNEMLELFRFIFSSILEREMTKKQEDIFDYATLLLLEKPGATIEDFLAILQPHGLEGYRDCLDRIDPISRTFFENQFDSKGPAGYEQTKSEVLQRLYSMLKNPILRDMFTNKHTRLDIGKELNEAKVIVVNTSEAILKRSGAKLFGRFILALIANATSQRALLGTQLPTYCYIDECYFYVENDPNALAIIARGRKRNLGLVLAHQWISQLGTDVPDALKGISAIKFAAGLNESDCHTLAAEMRCTWEFIRDQRRMSFAAYVKGMQNAESIMVPKLVMENMPKMSSPEFETVKNEMREKYSVAPRTPNRASHVVPPKHGDSDPDEWG